MATEKWIAGGLAATWVNCGSTATYWNALANGNSLLSDTASNNATYLDEFCDFSMSLSANTTAAGAPFYGLYIYPLTQDGSTYGEGLFGTTASGAPNPQYWVGNIPIQASKTTTAQYGYVRGIVLPPVNFKWVLYNASTNAFATVTAKYITYNRAIS